MVCKCSSCHCRYDEKGLKTVWVRYKTNTLIRSLCSDCIADLNHDKKILSYKIQP